MRVGWRPRTWGRTQHTIRDAEGRRGLLPRRRNLQPLARYFYSGTMTALSWVRGSVRWDRGLRARSSARTERAEKLDEICATSHFLDCGLCGRFGCAGSVAPDS